MFWTVFICLFLFWEILNLNLPFAVCRLPFAVNVTLNPSIFLVKSARFSCSLLCIFEVLWRGFSAFHSSWEPRLITNHHFEVARETGSRLSKCIVGLFWEKHFQHGGKFVPQKESHNALWQPCRPGPPRNLKVANRGRNKEKNAHGYDRRDWVQVGNQYSNLGNTCCKHQGSCGFTWLGAITEYVQKRNQIVSSYGL